MGFLNRKKQLKPKILGHFIGNYLSGNPNVNNTNVSVHIFLYETKMTIHKPKFLQGINEDNKLFEVPYDKLISIGSESGAKLTVTVVGRDKNNNPVHVPIVFKLYTTNSDGDRVPSGTDRDKLKAFLDQEIIKNQGVTI
jgi:hypothetical protein